MINTNSNDQSIFQELEKLSKRLQQSEALKSNFLSNIRNEINNPLSAILGLSQFLMQEKENVHRHALMIYQEAFNLNFQLQNIFAAADIEAGEIHYKSQTVDVRSLVESVVESFHFRASQKNIRFVVQWESDSRELSTDYYMLSMILTNLIANAIEFSFRDNVVIVTGRLRPDRIIVSIQDFGLGINPENQSRIFERFFQLDNGACKEHSGQGLGLSVVKEFVEILNGELSIKSAEGQGATFTVILPQLGASAASKMFLEEWNENLPDNPNVL